MLPAIIWGLVQGLTEFLPISSSGHLVVVPEFLDSIGLEMASPTLAVSAVLHLGTLIAVLAYFRREVWSVLTMHRNAEGRRVALLVGIGTVPAVIGLPLKGSLESLQDNVTYVGIALVGTGVILLAGQWLARGIRTLLDGRVPDAIVVGLAQALALIPGISRSGATIAAGSGRGFDPTEAARFSFLLGIPAIAGAGLISLPDVFNDGGLGVELLIGLLVAAVSGYLAIALLLAVLQRIGLVPFAIYCFVVGGLTIAFL